jgi:uncharacterized membrane protein (DUF485 family)
MIWPKSHVATPCGGPSCHQELLLMTHNARIGLVLFVIYLALYSGFVFLNAFAPEMMETTPFAGLNLAIVYGFGLIVAALLMSLLYGILCRDEPSTGKGGDDA